MTACPVEACDRPTDHGLCRTHRDHLVAYLRTIVAGPTDAKGQPTPGLAEELRTTMARLSRIGGGQLGVTSRDAERRLPWSETASQDLSALHHVVLGWALLINDDHGHEQLRADDHTTEGAARWLLRHPAWVAGHANAGELYINVEHVVTLATRTIDRAPDRHFAGPCATPDPETDQECDADLYTRSLTGTIRCRACGAEHDAAERRRWLLKHARDHLDTAPAIARALSVLCRDVLDGQALSVHRIRKWAERGQLTNRGHLPAVGARQPQPLYRVGDVEALVISMTTRKAS